MYNNLTIENIGNYNTLVLTSEYNESVISYMKNNNIKSLYLNYAKGWIGKNLEFLKEMRYLEALTIIDWNIADISQINDLKYLKYLEIGTHSKSTIDFSIFAQMEVCKIDWHNNIKNLFDCLTIKELFVNSYNKDNTVEFMKLINLESLSIANSSVINLDGLSHLKKLKYLGLFNLKKLFSLKGIENLNGIEVLEINGCKNLNGIEEIGYLNNIKRLELIDNKDIKSLKPIKNLNGLEQLYFYDSTNVLDGDLSYILLLKHLNEISFQDRKHYSLKLDYIKQNLVKT